MITPFNDPSTPFNDLMTPFNGSAVVPTEAGPVFGPGLDQRAVTASKKRKERERLDAANRRRDVEAVAAWLMLD